MTMVTTHGDGDDDDADHHDVKLVMTTMIMGTSATIVLMVSLEMMMKLAKQVMRLKMRLGKMVTI